MVARTTAWCSISASAQYSSGKEFSTVRTIDIGHHHHPYTLSLLIFFFFFLLLPPVGNQLLCCIPPSISFFFYIHFLLRFRVSQVHRNVKLFVPCKRCSRQCWCKQQFLLFIRYVQFNEPSNHIMDRL